MHLHFLPGLGFDHRIFQGLDLPGHQLHFHDWIEPTEKEPLAQYASRMLADVPTDAGQHCLIGHSLGGITAQEYAKQNPVAKVILLSSIKSREEMPNFFKVVAPLGLHHLFKKSWTTSTVSLWGKKHGYESPSEIALFKDMVRNQSDSYLQWALRTLSKWQTPPPNPQIPVVQVHGSVDRTFPLKRLRDPDVVLEDRGHFMVYRAPQEVSAAILQHVN